MKTMIKNLGITYCLVQLLVLIYGVVMLIHHIIFYVFNLY